MTMNMKIKDIPDEVLKDIAFQLKNYLVPICALSPNSAHHPFRFVGSGTLVKINRTYHVLTAAHVWSATKDMEEIGLILTDYPSMFKIPRSISTKQVWDGRISEWGPDLALLELPGSVVSTIETHKSFLNLTQQREMLLADMLSARKGLWMITGMVGEFSEFVHHSEKKIVEGTAEARGFFSVIHQTHQRDGYDYLDLSADIGLSGVPQSFGGVSGGGLWEINLSIDKSQKISWDGKRHFRGVAFWQSAIYDGRRDIRCHGPQSIFEMAWKVWDLPKS